MGKYAASCNTYTLGWDKSNNMDLSLSATTHTGSPTSGQKKGLLYSSVGMDFFIFLLIQT